MRRDVKIAIGAEAMVSFVFCAMAMWLDNPLFWWYAMIPWAVSAIMYVVTDS